MVVSLIVVLGALLLVLLVQAVLLSTSVGRYASYWRGQTSRETSDAALTYVVLGDSTAQGIGASSPTNGYVGLVAEHLAKTSGREVRVVNLSVSGARAQDVLNNQIPRLLEMELTGDSVITLAIGANDIIAAENPALDYQLVELITKLPAGTVVGDIPYFGDGRFRSREPRTVAANVVIRKQVAVSQLRLAHIYDVTKQHKSWHSMFTRKNVDMLHPNNRGYQDWADAFIAVLDN